MNSRSRNRIMYHPGDLVYFWRKQVSGRNAGKIGSFQGPARILAMETKRDAEGYPRPGSAIWCVKGRRLLKCAPEQLRPASGREELLEHLSQTIESSAPWTFPRLVASLGGNEYEDLGDDLPSLDQWTAAQEVSQMEGALRYRHQSKRPLAETRPQFEDGGDLEETPPTGAAPKIARSSGSDGYQGDLVDTAWWNQVEEREFAMTAEKTIWHRRDASVEIAIDIPESRTGRREWLRDMGAFFTNQMARRQGVEISEKHLTEAERTQFAEAKAKEVRNFISAGAFRALPLELKPTKEQAIGMRWILTWKRLDDGGRKAKARAILKGFQDPEYEYRSTTTPVMTRQTRQLLLHVAAWKRWQVKKVLQGRQYPNQLFCIPCPEILDAMGLEQGQIVQVMKGCYGLVDAPLEWYHSVSEYFASIGLIKSWSDPCCWLWKPKRVLRGIIAGHVDDFLFTGDRADKEWAGMEASIKEHFKWSDWEVDSFTQCGVQVAAQEDGSFHLSQVKYLDSVSEINLSASRRRDRQSETTEREKSQLRGILGALSWHAQQVAPHISAEIGLKLSEVSRSTVDTIMRANKLLYESRLRKDHKLVMHAFPSEATLGVFCWADAAGQNRIDGGSTQGLFIGVGPMSLLDGQMERVSPIAWHAGRIDRVTRSPGAAEARAVVNGEDLMFHVRFQLSEMLHAEVDVFHVEDMAKRIPGCLISDSRNVYDKLQTAELSAKGAERRTDIELLCLKASQRSTNLVIRWVHSEAQLGNALTKGGAKELESYYGLGGLWRIVHDPQMRSARKRRQDGLAPFEQQTSSS